MNFVNMCKRYLSFGDNIPNLSKLEFACGGLERGEDDTPCCGECGFQLRFVDEDARTQHQR